MGMEIASVENDYTGLPLILAIPFLIAKKDGAYHAPAADAIFLIENVG